MTNACLAWLLVLLPPPLPLSPPSPGGALMNFSPPLRGMVMPLCPLLLPPLLPSPGLEHRRVDTRHHRSLLRTPISQCLMSSISSVVVGSCRGPTSWLRSSLLKRQRMEKSLGWSLLHHFILTWSSALLCL